MSDPFATLGEWITRLVESLGYVGVAAFIALENIFPPIPSELILPLTGFLTGQGRMWLPGAIVAATVGSVIGALVLYWLGAWLGEDRLRRIVQRFGPYLTVSEDDLDRADRWFDEHGGKTVLFGRLVPVIRSLVSIPAGVRHMSLGRFVIYTTIGSSLWNSLLIGLGWWLGARWSLVRRYAQYFEYGVLAVLVVAVIWFVWRRRRAHPREANR